MNNYPLYVYVLPIIIALLGIIPTIISAISAKKSASDAARFYKHNIELDHAAVGFSHIDFTTFMNTQGTMNKIQLKFFFKNVGKQTAIIKLIDCRIIDPLGKTVVAPGNATSEWPVIGGGLAPFKVDLQLPNPVEKLDKIPHVVYALRLLFHPESEPNAISDRRYHFLFQGSSDIPYLNNDLYNEIAGFLPDDFKRK